MSGRASSGSRSVRVLSSTSRVRATKEPRESLRVSRVRETALLHAIEEAEFLLRLFALGSGLVGFLVAFAEEVEGHGWF